MFAAKKKLASAARTKARRRTLQVESLEQRKVMTVGMSIDAAGLLSIRGDNEANVITVYKSGSSTMVQSTTSDGVTSTSNLSSAVKSLDIHTFGGNDTVTNNTSLPATIWGGTGDDTLNGGSGRDYIYGQDGNDTLRGNIGSDVIYGGNGNDTIFGNAGTDYLYGNAGNDVLIGGGGSDYLYGNAGNDSLYGDDGFGAAIVDGVAAGKDSLYGGDGNDALTGGANDDLLHGDGNDDYLFGQDGNDRLFGDAGYDTLYGMIGDDFLDAGSNGEFTNGGDGNDFNAYTSVINGATTDDIAQGGANNCFILSAMGAAASRGVDMASRITYTGNGNYNVLLFQAGSMGTYTPTTVSVHFDGTLNMTDPKAHFRGQEGESWPVIMNRALAQLLNVDLTTTTGGYAGTVLGAILGRAPATTTWIDDTGFVSPFNRDGVLDYLYAVGNAAPTIVGTRNSDAMMGSNLFASNHVYMVKAVLISGYTFAPGTFQMIPQYTIMLANPWGTDTSDDRIANGTGRASGDNTDGLIVISGSEFKRNFDEITLA